MFSFNFSFGWTNLELDALMALCASFVTGERREKRSCIKPAQKSY